MGQEDDIMESRTSHRPCHGSETWLDRRPGLRLRRLSGRASWMATCAAAWMVAAAAPARAQVRVAPTPAEPTQAGPMQAEPVTQPNTTMSTAAPATPLAAVTRRVARVVTPHLVIAGGLRLENLQQRTGATAQSRSPTVAVSQIGLRGRVGEHVTFASEFEANIGGDLGYGASVWEGQAQMSVRDQYVQYARRGVAVAVGRITDHATIDFMSAHVADLLFADAYTRYQLLYSGADRGTGLMARYRVADGVELGLTLHSTNPTGLTGTYLIGGTLSPFDRPFSLASAQVGRSQFTLPDQNLHIYFGTPSVTYTDELLELKAAAEVYQLDTQMAIADDQRIYGYNVRASLKLKLLDGRLVPFGNASRNSNEMLDPMDARFKLVDTFQSYTFSGGIDYNYQGQNGVGVQYAHIRQTEPMVGTVVEHFINLGATYWLEEGVSVGARLGWFIRDDENVGELFGHRSLFLTGRMIL